MDNVDNQDVIDVEAYVKEGKPIPHVANYRIRIGTQYFVVHSPTITGRQILKLAGKEPPEDYEVFQKLRHGQLEPVGLDQEVDLQVHGVERFVVQPLENKDG